MTTIKDSEGNDLEVGAMYCCVFTVPDGDGERDDYGQLVRYVGVQFGRPTFADADEWDETVCDFDKLVRQAAPIIDPSTKGW
ncbi:MAG: hypothetical protein ACTHKN_21650 [Achromobacter mucicolens]